MERNVEQRDIDNLQHEWLVDECANARALNLGSGMRPIPGAVNLDPNPDRWAWADLGADAHRLPFPDGTFDVVVSNHVLPHFRDPEAALREMARVLDLGGRIAHVVPDLRYAPRRRETRHPFADQPHGWYGPADFWQLAQRLDDVFYFVELENFSEFRWSFKVRAVRL